MKGNQGHRDHREAPAPSDVRALGNAPLRSPDSVDGRIENDDQRIRFAIANKRLLKFLLYDLWRIGEPHDYGIRSGAPQLLMYQVRGESQSGKLPAWRWVVLGHVSSLEVLEETFAGSRNEQVQHHIQWDRLFARVV